MSERHRRDPRPTRWSRIAGLGERLDRLFPEDRTFALGHAGQPALQGDDASPGEQQASERRPGLPSVVVVAAPAAILLAAGIAASATLFWNDSDDLVSGSAGGARAQVSTGRSPSDLRGLGRLLIEPGELAGSGGQPNSAPLPEDAPVSAGTTSAIQTPSAPPAAGEAVEGEPANDVRPADQAGVDDDGLPPAGSGVAGDAAADGDAAGEDEAARFEQTVRPVIEDLLASPPAAGPDEPAPPALLEEQTRDNDYPAASPSSSPTAAAPPDRALARPDPRPAAPPKPAPSLLNSAEPGTVEPEAGAARVFVHYPARSERARDAATATARHLEAAGYQVADIRTVGFDVANARVRYFFDGDRAAAQRLASDLRAYLASTAPGHPSVDLQSFTTFEPLPAPGNIEVWIPSAGAP